MRALTHALEQKRLHHAWLFTGTRGVGKTTLSRILAKALNCQGADGKGDVTAQPCGVCDACTSIDAGRFVDYIELDAASNRGVDEMVQLLEQAVYAPSSARYKVYMIDEVHMLTAHAFNAMLKTLEEPPEHVKFILATTDPQKIPVTVLSRCLQFNLKQMPPGHIVGHLENILGQENIGFDTGALRLLAHGAQGSMRDALSLTDQAIAYSGGNITLEAVQGMLGALDQSYLVRLLDALAAGDGAGLLAVADEMAVRSLSYNAALQDLGSLLHRIALAQTVPAALPEDLPEREDILRLAGQMQADEVQLYYQIAVHGRNELGLAPDEYAGFTMSLLRMLAFRPLESAGQAAPPPPVAARPPAAALAANASAAGARAAAPLPAAAAPAARSAVVPAPPASGRPAGGPARAALDAARVGIRTVPGAARPATQPPMPMPQAAGVANVVRQELAAWEDAHELADSAQPAQSAAPTFSDEAPAGSAMPQQSPISIAAADAVIAEAVIPARPAAAPPGPVTIPGWNDGWPSLAAALPLRGVVQQLALQSELIECRESDGALAFHLRIAVETLRSSGSPEKLEAALADQLGRRVQLSTEIGPVILTANALATAQRELRQREAEQKMHDDPFVQTLMREFGATVVPGSVRPN